MHVYLEFLTRFPHGFDSERIDCVSRCAFGPMKLALCQKHTKPLYNLCSHKVPEQLPHSGTFPGRNKLPFSAIPSHSHPAALGAWMGKWLVIKILFPLVNKFSKAWKIQLKTKSLSPKELCSIPLEVCPVFASFIKHSRVNDLSVLMDIKYICRSAFILRVL